MTKDGIKQVAVRLTRDQAIKLNHYLADREISFQALALELLSPIVGK